MASLICSKCRIRVRHVPSSGNVRTYCCECERQWARQNWQTNPRHRAWEREWISRNREHVNARARLRYDPIRSHEYYLKNREKLAQYHKRRYIQNPEKCKLSTKQWRQANPGAIKMLTRKYHAQRKGAIGAFDLTTIRRLFWFQDGRCQYCQNSLNVYHIEHRLPISRGGSNFPANLCLACPSCNSRKNKKTDTEFFAFLGVK